MGGHCALAPLLSWDQGICGFEGFTVLGVLGVSFGGLGPEPLQALSLACLGAHSEAEDVADATEEAVQERHRRGDGRSARFHGGRGERSGSGLAEDGST